MEIDEENIYLRTSEAEMEEKLKAYLDEQAGQDRFSGSVMVAHDGHPFFTYSAGFANKETNIPNSIETRFNLGSCNKMFTGIAIALLVEQSEGKVSFLDPVGKFLPDYSNAEVRESVTLHHLLTHTSGLGSFIDVKYRDQFLAARENLTSIQAVVDLFKDRPLEFLLGSVHYSSDGYELLGLIVEKLSGQDYYDYVRENVFEKAGMVKTDNYLVDPNNIPDDLAVGYTNRNPQTNRMEEGERFPNFDLNLVKGTAGGSGYSTCPDLINFAQALINHKLLSPEMTEKVLTPYVIEGSKDGMTKAYGYGFQVWDVRGTKRIGHPGRFAGVSARLDVYPELGYTVVALANYDPPIASDIGDKVGDLILNN